MVKKLYATTPSAELQLRKNLAYVSDTMVKELIKVEWIDGSRQLADMMTKEKSTCKEIFRRALEEGMLPNLPVTL